MISFGIRGPAGLAVAAVGVAEATVPVAFAPVAHADEQSDFLGCLTNHGLQITDRQVVIDTGGEVVNLLRTGQLMPEAAPFYVEHHYGVSPHIAQIEVECAHAAILMNGH